MGLKYVDWFWQSGIWSSFLGKFLGLNDQSAPDVNLFDGINLIKTILILTVWRSNLNIRIKFHFQFFA